MEGVTSKNKFLRKTCHHLNGKPLLILTISVYWFRRDEWRWDGYVIRKNIAGQKMPPTSTAYLDLYSRSKPPPFEVFWTWVVTTLNRGHPHLNPASNYIHRLTFRSSHRFLFFKPTVSQGPRWRRRRWDKANGNWQPTDVYREWALFALTLGLASLLCCCGRRRVSRKMAPSRPKYRLLSGVSAW